MKLKGSAKCCVLGAEKLRPCGPSFIDPKLPSLSVALFALSQHTVRSTQHLPFPLVTFVTTVTPSRGQQYVGR